MPSAVDFHCLQSQASSAARQVAQVGQVPVVDSGRSSCRVCTPCVYPCMIYIYIYTYIYIQLYLCIYTCTYAHGTNIYMIIP